MTADNRAALLAAVNDGDGVHQALRALRHAMAWSVHALTTAELPDRTDPAAIELVMVLDDALAGVDELVKHVPRIAENGTAGEPVTEYLRQQADALSALADHVTVARHEHEALAAVEAELVACRVEHDAIAAEIDELRRLERLSGALPDLRTQRDGLARRMDAMVTPVATAEQALLETAQHVITLRTEQIADLDARTASTLTTLRETEAGWAALSAEHAEAEAKLAEKRAQYAELAKERETRLVFLRQHTEIDHDLLDRLSAARDSAGARLRDGIAADGTVVDQVRGLLVTTESLVSQVDGALRDMLQRYNELSDEYHRALTWADHDT